MHLQPFTNIFYNQIYFLIIYQHIDEKPESKERAGYKIVGAQLLISLIVIVAWTISSYSNDIIAFDDRDFAYGCVNIKNIPSNTMVWIQNLLHIPFNFYYGKEFLLTLIDELWKKGTSKRVDQQRERI